MLKSLLRLQANAAPHIHFNNDAKIERKQGHEEAKTIQW